MRRSVSIGGLALIVALGAAGLGVGHKSSIARAQDKPSSAEVKIDNFSFGPASLTVAVGTTVIWTNRDDIPHTVVSTDDAKTFKSKVLDTDEKFSFAFTKAGTYPYFCSIHPKMTGKVIVQ
ncbi:MAG TPA: cupredoxin family copper-binding protein [Bryobacteraceae bacterium]|jgi:plastocyanin|nr:cupredoxin family copper-binding protein [Bryobacteraceae bacterium]